MTSRPRPPTVETYKLSAINGRTIRKATVVTLEDGTEVRFTEPIRSKREAIRQARLHLERGLVR